MADQIEGPDHPSRPAAAGIVINHHLPIAAVADAFKEPLQLRQRGQLAGGRCRTATELAWRDMHRTGDMPAGILFRIAEVDHQQLGVIAQALLQLPGSDQVGQVHKCQLVKIAMAVFYRSGLQKPKVFSAGWPYRGCSAVETGVDFKS